MTSHRDFIDAVSEATGWPLPDLRHRLRWLRQAGQIKGGKAGRGGAGAAQIDSEAAARLILSIAASYTATLAPEAVNHAWFLEPLIFIDPRHHPRSKRGKTVWRRRKPPPLDVKLVNIPDALRSVCVPIGKTVDAEVNQKNRQIVRFFGRPLGEAVSEVIELARNVDTRPAVEKYFRILLFDQGTAHAQVEFYDDQKKRAVIQYPRFESFESGDWFYRDKHKLGGRITLGIERQIWMPTEFFLFVADLIGLIEEPPADA